MPTATCPLLVSIIALALASCAPDVRTTRLDTVDLGDMETVREIRSQLDANDGIAFANFVVKHNALSKHFCGQPLVNSDGLPPTTVGEAIELTAQRDAQAFNSRVPQGEQNSQQIARERWDNLISERDMLIDAQALIRADLGPKAELDPTWKSLDERLAVVNERLVKMKPSAFGPS